jgi:hypothetical protein
MKTNVTLIREDDRFVQRTKDGYFNANLLAKSKGLVVGDYKKNKKTKDFIEQLKSEGIENPFIAGGKGTWMHPKLFIDFAMWVSVEFKSIVIDYVLDGLIKSRNEAGDYYNQMCATIMSTYINLHERKPPAHLYMDEARMIKDIVGVSNRNEASECKLDLITTMQKLNSTLIKKGIGKDSRRKRLIDLKESFEL